MSSNNQGGGPWRSQGRGPWGQGPSGPQPTADLEEIIRRVQEALGKLTASGGSGSGGSGKGGFTGRTGLFLILGAVLVWFAWGTFYSVQPNEVGINLVLGRYTGKTAAGLNTNWPWPIGTVIKVPVWDQQITEVGYRSLGSNADIPEESQMLTGDKNIVDVHFRVNWQIDPAKPEDYVFNILGPRLTAKVVPPHANRAAAARSIATVPSKDRNRASRSRPRRTARSPLTPPRLSNSPSRFCGEGDGERNRIFAEAYGADPDSLPSTDPCSLPEQLQQRPDLGADQSEVGLLPRHPSTPTPPPEAPSAQSPAASSGGGSESGLKCATSASRSGWC